DEDSFSAQHGCRLVQGRTVELLGNAKAPPGGAGRGVGGTSSVVVLARTRPDEGVAFAVLVVEQVRVDRRVEGGIVELEREVVAALFGALRPGGSDLGPAHIDAVARSVVVGAIALGDDADALGLHAQGDDLALELAAADLLEGTDIGHVTSSFF